MKEKAQHIIFPERSLVFDTVPHNIFLDKSSFEMHSTPSQSIEVILALYFASVQLHLEYCAYSGLHNMKRMLRYLKAFTKGHKLVAGLGDMRAFKLPSLEKRPSFSASP